MKILSKALAGAVVSGAMVLSAAAPALAADGHGRGDFDRNGWNGSGNSQRAVQMCSRVAESQANRHSDGRARVTDIRDVRNTRGGFEVRGRLAVNSRDHGRHAGGWRGSNLNRDSGTFTCRVQRGRVAHIDFDGIRGL